MLYFQFSVTLQIILLHKVVSYSTDENKYSDESLTPYLKKHGSQLNHRVIRECHEQKYGSAPHILHFTETSLDTTVPFVKVKRFVKTLKSSYRSRTIRGHFIKITNPLETLSVLEPDQPGGCALNIRQTVAETARKNKCFVAINAGYFDTKEGKCLGNVVSDGRKAHDSNGIQNAHFGLTDDGQIFTGYLSQELYHSGTFKQLVGGVVWILRNGTGFVNASKSLECEDTEETGPMENFVSIFSARTAVGHDKDGNVVFLQIDGKSNIDGVNLHDMEVLLKEFGVVNAINLDGGGSSTLVINGTTANYPYDECPNESFSCDRKVSTVLCVHEPYCDPIDCNHHGTCTMGKCACEENWLPPRCDKLFCGETNCSNNGICLSEGCHCHPGYIGKECNETCPEGWFGSMCKSRCKCTNSVGCDPVSGTCVCQKGFTGEMCQQTCPPGFFGINCQFKCQCNNTCCDPIRGSCSVPYNSSIYGYSKCIAQLIVDDQHLIKDNPSERWRLYTTMIILGVITASCIASCLLISCLTCSCYCQNEQLLCFKKTKHSSSKHKLT
ncbi:N-acetylglucosamine-1-phosphodiester alpha-N-acetylglucosaminidase, partial [Parasteatoda tepidariorum]|uniref:N-acetylglucosamine-1-phosphodiester alpha-N-acetylglucosaminidase n=1 Tax=Parasteatoda tepidariorum TaxID=114398 RepID=UPI0039BD5530